jgi:hypothetical protein
MWKHSTCNRVLLPAECIGGLEPTRGTETSKYPQEKKETSIPSVAASESGTAQTGVRPGVAEAMRGYKTATNQSVWNVAPQRVTVP